LAHHGTESIVAKVFATTRTKVYNIFITIITYTTKKTTDAASHPTLGRLGTGHEHLYWSEKNFGHDQNAATWEVHFEQLCKFQAELGHLKLSESMHKGTEWYPLAGAVDARAAPKLYQS
jgi:hypothetical protein